MRSIPAGLIFTVAIALLVVLSQAGSAATTEVRITLYSADGSTVLNETTVDYRWMEQHLPVMGDGTTHYYHQGPVFVDDPGERWNPAEDANVLEKDMGAVKGTDLRLLCDLVGGMEPGDTVTLRASDGFAKTFAYENVYEPPSRQGPMVVTWYHSNQSYVPGYADGLKLVFFADTSTNPWGVHAFGNEDWHESAAEEYWYYYYQGQDRYPTTTGLAVKYLSRIEISSSRQPVGSIEVASTPGGARVFLDDLDTGLDTPCLLEELGEGFYSIRVEKRGFLPPDEISVEVVAGTRAGASFELVPAPPAGGSQDSGDDATVFPDPDSGWLSGGQLTEAESFQINGSFLLVPSTTMPFTIGGGEEKDLLFAPAAEQKEVPAFTRFYLFLDESHADPGISLEPDITVSLEGDELAPVRVYSERGGGDRVAGTTLVYSFPRKGEDRTISIFSGNSRSWNSTVAGALLAEGYEGTGPNQTHVRICEGADLIRQAGGEESPMTAVEFGRADTGHAGGEITLFTVSTPVTAAGNLSFFIDGANVQGLLVPGDGPVVVHEIAASGSPGRGPIRLHIADSGSGVMNRVSFLTERYPPPALETPAGVDVGVREVNVPESPVTPPPRSMGGTPALSQIPREAPASTPDPIGNFLCWLLNLILALQGNPPESCPPQGEHPGMEAGPTQIPGGGSPSFPLPDPVRVLIRSDPPGAMVSLDGTLSGNLTPATVVLTPGETYTLGITREGYLPFEGDIHGEDGTVEIQLEPVRIQAGSPANPPESARYGGLYILSYPEKAEIRVDGILAGSNTPYMVYPVKEGFHTISAGIPLGGNALSGKESLRTWAFAGVMMPVEFNLMDTTQVRIFNITSESRGGGKFTVNGYYPVKRIPQRIEIAGQPSFITLVGESGYLSFTLPGIQGEDDGFKIPGSDPSLCNLSVASDPPGAEIFLDGIRTGLLTPSRIPNVSAGYHRISITDKGRLPVTELLQIAEIDCVRGEFTVHYRTEPYPCGSISLVSDPPGAAVLFRGLKTGEVTPCTLENVPIGVWEVTLTHGKTKKTLDATVEPGKDRKYSVGFT